MSCLSWICFPGDQEAERQATSTYISEQVLPLVGSQDRLIQGVVRLQALANGPLAVTLPALHLAVAQCSLDHHLHGAVKHDDSVGGSAHLGTQERGWIRKRLGPMVPYSSRAQESRIRIVSQ